jgi:hypothetical protein
LEQREPETYETELDGKGQIKSVLRQPGAIQIPADFNDQRFCDFLSAASNMNPQPNLGLEGQLPPHCHFFAEMDRLFEHCKRFGIMICTSRALPDGREVLEHVGCIDFAGWGHPFRSLPVTVARRDDEGQRSLSGVACASSKTFLTGSLAHALQNELLSGDESSTIRRLSTWTIDRAFVYLDVSDFSKYPPGQEVLIINSVVSVVGHPNYWDIPPALTARDSVEAKLCIGDGYIFVFKNPMLATFFAAYLARLIEILVARKALPVDFHFRMGVHFGPVYSFWDPGRNDWNYIGEGINGGQRVLEAVGKDQDDVVFVSGRVYEWLTAEDHGQPPCHQIVKALRNRGRKEDKHHNPWRVYEVDHVGLATLALPGSLGSFKEPR